MYRRVLLGAFLAAAAVCGSLLLLRTDGSRKPLHRERGFDQPLHAAAYRQYQRRSEDGTIPDGAWMKAKLQRDALVSRRTLHAGIHPASWTWLGPGNIGGRVRPIVFDPRDPNTIYIGTASGGIWKTVNGGSSWAPLDDFIPGLAVSALAVDPSNPNVLYAGTGEGFAEWPDGTSNTAFMRGIGILKSTDAGESWDLIPSTAGPDFRFVNRLAICPPDPSILLAATATGVWRSTNFGQTWALARAGYAYDVRFHPASPNRAWVGLHDGGVAYSTDAGATWTDSSGATGHRCELAIYPPDPLIVYAAVSDNDRIKVYRSTNGGQTFSLRTTGNGVATYSAYNSALWVDPTNPNTLILGGVYLYRSTDGGAMFGSQVFSGVHADIHAIVSHPLFNGTTNRTVYFGTDGGMYRTTDAYASSSTSLNNNIGATQFYGAVMNPISGVAFGGTQDNGTLRFTGNPQAWTHPFGGDGGYAATDPTNSNYFYGEYQWAQIYRSTNGGASGSNIYSGITDAGGTLTNFMTYFLLDPNNPSRMLVGCRRLWRTNDVKAGTVSWSIIKPSIETNRPDPPGAHFMGNSPFNISTISIAQGNSDLILVGYNNGQVWKTTNGTATTPTWSRIDDDAGPMPLRWVSKIVIDPNNTDRITVAFMGWEPDNLWRSTDGGATWRPLIGSGQGAFPSVPVSALAMHPTEPGWLYAGTDLGLFTSVDDGATWVASNQGPALVPIEELHWVDAQTLLAVTHGRGLYKATVLPGTDPNSPNTFRVVIGTLLKGQLPWLFYSDDKRVQVRTDLSADSVLSALVELTSQVSHSNPSELRFTVESSASEDSLAMHILLYNYAQSRWDTLHTRQTSLSDTIAQVSVTGNASQYVDPATRAVKARIGWGPGASESAAAWSVRIDQAWWTSIR